MRNTHSYDAIWSSAHRRSHPEPDHKNPQKRPSGKLLGLLVWRRNNRNVLRQNYDAKPRPIPHNPAVLLPSAHSSTLSNFQKLIALPSVMHHFLTLLIQKLRMVTSTIRNLLCQNQPENRSQNQDLRRCHRSQNRLGVGSRNIVVQ